MKENPPVTGNFTPKARPGKISHLTFEGTDKYNENKLQLTILTVTFTYSTCNNFKILNTDT